LAGLVAGNVQATLARWQALGGVDDPLLATWVLGALERPPFVGPSARPLLEAFVEAAERLRDSRLAGRHELHPPGRAVAHSSSTVAHIGSSSTSCAFFPTERMMSAIDRNPRSKVDCE
jgi:hypothetical protein